MLKARCLRWLVVFGSFVLVGLFIHLTATPAHANPTACRYAPQQVLITGTASDLTTLPTAWHRMATIELAGQETPRLIAAYQLPRSISVPEALAHIAQHPRLLADPNCYIAGSGWSIVGSGGWSPLSNAPAAQFSTQSAYTSTTGGIALYHQARRTVEEKGNDITIGFIDSVDSNALGGAGATYTALFPTGSSTYPVAVYDLQATLPLSFTVPVVGGTPYVGSHGAFGISLAHEVAPEADYRLYGVLNQSGQGTLFAALSAMNNFITDPTVVSQKSVLNLSWQVVGTKSTITSLETMVQTAINDGIVVVAAAGNDSAGITPQAAGTPANLPTVIPVAAVNGVNASSCYSNAAWYSAPGGDGVGLSCTTPTFTQCATSPVNCLIGYDPTSPTQYSYWAGTSFSAALVSGATALMLEVEPTLTPSTLHGVVNGSVTSLGPVLKVPDLVNLVR
jgi:subtilisin family serine protease